MPKSRAPTRKGGAPGQQKPTRDGQPIARRDFAGDAIAIRAQFVPSSFNPETRTIDLVWSVGAAVERRSWDGSVAYVEVLSMAPGACQLDRLNKGGPFLNSHNHWAPVEDLLGRFVPGSCRVTDGAPYGWDGPVCVGTVLLASPVDERGDLAQALRNIETGIAPNVSVGYDPIETKTEKREGQPDLVTVTVWKPYEVSSVTMPADVDAQVRSRTQETAMLTEAEKKIVRALGLKLRIDDAVIQEAIDSCATCADACQKLMDAQAAEAATGDDGGEGGGEGDDGMARGTKPAAEDPAVRSKIVFTTLRALGEPAERAEALLESKLSGAQLRDQLINERAAKTPKVRTASGVQFQRDHGDEVKRGVENALLHRYTNTTKLDDAGRAFRGESVLSMGEELVLALGGTRDMFRGKSKAQRAHALMTFRSGGHSTSDFPLVLENVLGKRLLEAYEQEGINFEEVGTKAMLPDLKEVSRVAIGEAPALLPVLEGAEYKYGVVSERAEKYSLGKFGRRIGLTEEMLINDDLNAFTQLIDGAGEASARVQKDIFWGLITANAAMSDGIAFFHASHKNLGSAAAFDAAKLGLLRALMRKQTGVNADVRVTIFPTHLIGGVDLENTFDQVLNGLYVPTSSSGATTPVMRSLKTLTEPRLDATPNPWFLAAGKRGIEYGYLDGEEGPIVTMHEEWKSDRIEWKVKVRFAAKPIDHRYWAKNAGA